MVQLLSEGVDLLLHGIHYSGLRVPVHHWTVLDTTSLRTKRTYTQANPVHTDW